LCAIALLTPPTAASAATGPAGVAVAAPGAATPDVRLVASAPGPLAQRRTTAVSLRLSASKIRKGELIWFSGRVAGPSASGRKVVLERRKPGATKWKAYTSTRTKASGKFAGSVRPAAAYQYRVRV